MLIVFLILYLYFLSVCLRFRVHFYLRHGLVAVILVGQFLITMQLFDGEMLTLLANCFLNCVPVCPVSFSMF